MNKFAGNVTYKGEVDLHNLDYNLLEIETPVGNTVVYLHGKTEFSSSLKLLDELKKYGEILSSDISLSGESKVTILSEDFGEGIYELATFEGIDITYEEILERFNEAYEVLSVRESGVSENYGNKIIKVDFAY